MELIANLAALLQKKLLSKVPNFAEDAFIFIFPLGILAFVLLVVSCTSAFFGFLVCLVLIALIICFFRDPERTIDDNAPDALVSPADGKIKHIIENEDNPYTGKSCTRVTIFLSVLDVHINRIPMAGTIEQIDFKKDGKYLVADRPAASVENVQNTLVIKNGDTVVVVKQIVGLIARRIVCWAKEGETFERGQRFGLIRFGSRVDILVPVGTQIKVKEGDRVAGGKSIIGYLTPAQ
ncbi:Phosphatidylserine decarboxylase [hydrothermal vent metagenome]|uniref:Phosphatidylserine decarboxylase n=1 Tax=hydrothermal vent metagenome TaxID=652676 RepID=A0A3B1CVA4_9ZZZZ